MNRATVKGATRASISWLSVIFASVAAGAEITFPETWAKNVNTDSSFQIAHDDTVANYGNVNNSGAVSNSGVLYNYSAGTITNVGLLNNYGFFHNNGAGTVNNFGTMNNNGFFYNNSASTLNNIDGDLVNNGTLVNHATLVVVGDNEGISFSARLVNNGSLVNALGVLTNHGNADNYGALNNEAGSTLVNKHYLENFGTLTNAGTLNNDSFLHNAGGTLINNLGGILTVSSDAELVNEGTLINTGSIISTGKLINSENGIITIADGVMNAATIISEGTLNLRGGTLQFDSFSGNLDNTGGTVKLGHSLGITAVSGNYSQDTNSTLAIDIRGLHAGIEYDVLKVTGLVVLDGMLDIYWDYAGLAQGDSFNILVADTITGVFSSIRTPQISEGLVWKISYSTDGSGEDIVTASVVPAQILPGVDSDGDTICDNGVDVPGVCAAGPDVGDNCPLTPNPDQLNSDGANDGGDACDTDDDNDNWLDVDDNCSLLANPYQEDFDKDGFGDKCDNCLITSNPNQVDINNDGVGDHCAAIGC